MADVRLELTDELLGAYADDELDATTRARVERALSVSTEARARVAAIRDITMLVRAATHVAGVAREPSTRLHETLHSVPSEPLDPPPRRHATARLRRWAPAWAQWRLAAAFLAGVATILVALQLAPSDGNDDPLWPQSALEFHTRYLRAASNGGGIALDHLQPTSRDFALKFIDLAEFEPRIPDLTNQRFSPTGARVLATPDGTAAFVLFESDDQPSIGFSMIRSDRPARTEFALHERRGLQMISWNDGRFEYGVSGRLSPDALEVLANSVRSSLGAATLGGQLL